MERKTEQHFETLRELRNAIALMKSRQAQQEDEIRAGVKELGESLKPGNLIRNALHAFTTDQHLQSDLARKGTEAAAGFLISNLVFRKFGPIVRTVASLAGTALISNFFGEHAPSYREKFKKLITKIRSMLKNETFDERDIFS